MSDAIRNTQDARRLGRIGVLLGGSSTERDISIKSGKAVYEALVSLGLDAVMVDITGENTAGDQITKENIKVAFIALHGRFGEDGTLQAILESMNIPYTGSGVLASQLAMDKIVSRAIFEKKNLNVPKYKVLKKKIFSPDIDHLMFPIVAKPATHGSSIGLSIANNKKELNKAIETAFEYDTRVILEEYIPGKEITVGILDDEPLPVIQISPKRQFFDYTAKYTSGLTEYIVPAKLPPVVSRNAQEAGISAHKALGCKSFSRVDMILDGNNRCVVLEVNTIPGLTAISLLPKAAACIGIDFPTLCLKIVESALNKNG